MKSKYPSPSVSAVIVNTEGKCLLTRRSSKVLAPGQWCVPGGHLDGGNDWVSTLQKEVAEEVGLKVKRHELIGIYSDPKLHALDEANGEKRFFVTATFLVTEFDGDVKLNEESDAFEWFAPDALPEPLMASDSVKIKDAFAYSGEVFIR